MKYALRDLIFRLIGGLVGLLFIAVSPVLYFCLDGFDKIAAIPPVFLGTLFILYALRKQR